MGMPLTHHRFTVDEYRRMGETGIFSENDRVELLDGQIVEMTPIGPRHAGCVGALATMLGRRLPNQVILWVQSPIRLGEYDEPQPDVALVRERVDGYRTGLPLPDDVLLVVEVADTSIRTDRQAKLPLYASAGIREAWLVDLGTQTIEVHRRPLDGQYHDVETVRPGQTLRATQVPEVVLPVSGVLGSEN